jgi:benzoate/toluate 1,2-dioxygenase alpha subunit
VFRPIAPDLTEVSFYATRLADNTDAENAKMIRRFIEIHGPAGHAIPDDVEMHERCQEGVKVKANEWLPFGRGMHNEVIDEGDGVVRVLDSSDEAPNRTFYKQWKRLMSQSRETQTPAASELVAVGD